MIGHAILIKLKDLVDKAIKITFFINLVEFWINDACKNEHFSKKDCYWPHVLRPCDLVSPCVFPPPTEVKTLVKWCIANIG